MPGSGELIRRREPCESGTDHDDVGGSGTGTVHVRAPFVCGLPASASYCTDKSVQFQLGEFTRRYG
ncbi:hypothetical protein GCM10020220_017360 [Nonomuraea rubra]